MSQQPGSSSDPFQQPRPGASGEGDRRSFQNFVSATPLPGYVYSPELALYLDPNMPKDLQPHYVTLKNPQTGRTATVPYTGERPTEFLDMMQQPIATNPGQEAIPGYGQPSGEQNLDMFIHGPTQRPNEPVTAGVPVGSGPQFVRVPGEADQQFRNRIGEDLMRSAVKTDPLIRSFALRLMAGE